MSDDKKDVAGVIAFPPLIYGAPLALAVAFDRLFNSKRLPVAARFLSLGFFVAGASTVASAFVALKRAGTYIDVNEETTAIVEDGPYAYTRNPICLGLTFGYIGVSLAARTALPLAILPGVLWVMNAGVIEREERYLERKFGKTYRAYRDRVPRWV